MTTTNFRDLLETRMPFTTDDGHRLLRTATPEELLARPVPWVDCPTCDGRGVTITPSSVANAFFAVTAGATLARGAGVPHLTCPACTGTGKATVAQLLAWGSAVALSAPNSDDPSSDNYWGEPDFPFEAFEAVDDYRNRILDTQP